MRQLAARSSAVAEDGRSSFAGQYESVLRHRSARCGCVAAYLPGRGRQVRGQGHHLPDPDRATADDETPMAVLFRAHAAPAVASGRALHPRQRRSGRAHGRLCRTGPRRGPGRGRGQSRNGSPCPTTRPTCLLDRQTLEAPVLPEADALPAGRPGPGAWNRPSARPRTWNGSCRPKGGPVILQSRPMAVERTGQPARCRTVRRRPAPPEGLTPLAEGGHVRLGAACATGIGAPCRDQSSTWRPSGPGTVLVTADPAHDPGPGRGPTGGGGRRSGQPGRSFRLGGPGIRPARRSPGCPKRPLRVPGPKGPRK